GCGGKGGEGATGCVGGNRGGVGARGGGGRGGGGGSGVILGPGGGGVPPRQDRHFGQVQDLTRIDPMRVFDDGGVEAVDLGPEEWVVEIHLRDRPQRLTARNGVTVRNLSLEDAGRLCRVLSLDPPPGVPRFGSALRGRDAPQQRQRRQGQYRSATRTADRRPPHPAPPGTRRAILGLLPLPCRRFPRLPSQPLPLLERLRLSSPT